MNFNVPVTLAAILVSLTCLTLSTVSGKEATEVDINELLERLDAMADDTREARLETKTAREETKTAKEETKTAREETKTAREDTERARLETKEVKSTLKVTTGRLQHLEHIVRRDNMVLKQQMDDLMADTKHEEDSVAFSVVSYEGFGPVTVDANIPYEVTYINIGGGWNSVINAFHVPIRGVYVFTASMVCHGGSNEWIDVHIVHTTSVGQTRVASMYGASIGSGDANTVIIEVEQDDLVSVQLDGDRVGYIASYSSRLYSTFSGFLLFTLG